MRQDGNSRGPIWTGPPGLTAKQKKNLREKERQARLRKDRAWVEKEKLRSQRKNDREQAARRQGPRPEEIRQAGLTLIDRSTLRAPRLAWMDSAGRLHREEELSAEELIEDWKLNFTRKHK